MKPAFEKRCASCKEIKPLTCFHRRPGTKYFQSSCKECQKLSMRNYVQRLRDDSSLYRKYRRERNDWHIQYKAKRIEAGYPLYISMQQRVEAIMKLI